MIDELLEMFERDGNKERRPAGERRGIRGMFSRMFSSDADEDGDERRNRHDERGQRRRRDDDGFDFD